MVLVVHKPRKTSPKQIEPNEFTKNKNSTQEAKRRNHEISRPTYKSRRSNIGDGNRHRSNIGTKQQRIKRLPHRHVDPPCKRKTEKEIEQFGRELSVLDEPARGKNVRTRKDRKLKAYTKL